MLLRLSMSLVFGAIIGIERQWHHKTAGIKTNTLVSIGATVFTLVSAEAFGLHNNNPAQVAAGVVAGVGFIGGGVIMRRSGNVQGINTAATLWAAASLGVVIGVGYYFLAIIVFAAILFVQFALRWASAAIDRKSGSLIPLTYKIGIVFETAATGGVHRLWDDFASQRGVQTRSYSVVTGPEGLCSIDASLGLSEIRAQEMEALSRRFAQAAGVTKVVWSQETATLNE
ncbi:MAG TPA: MgtC/SapB family protein [Blastocatellia bacterium]